MKTFFPYVTGQILAACLLGSVGCGSDSTGGNTGAGGDMDAGGDMSSPYIGDPQKPPATSAPLFDESKILDFKLTIADDQWALFQKILDNPPPPAMRDTYTKVYVHCGFEALGMMFPNAACRPKGNPLTWADQKKKPQFVIKFDHWDNAGRFLGLRAVNLEANPAVDAPVRDRIGMWLMRQSGVKASRVNHVRVFKNNALLGLYMNIEEVDQEFLKWQFSSPKGNLYSQGFKLQTNMSMPDTSRLTALNDLVYNEPATGDHSKFFAAFDKMVDMPALLAETAAEVVEPAGDNWSCGGSNYFWYDDPATGKFILLPWDLDTTMRPDYGPATADLYNFHGVPGYGLTGNDYLKLIYQNPAWKKQFEDNLVKLRDGLYTQMMPAYIDQVCAQIRDAFIADPNKDATLDGFDKDCAYLKQHITNRAAYIRKTLGR